MRLAVRDLHDVTKPHRRRGDGLLVLKARELFRLGARAGSVAPDREIEDTVVSLRPDRRPDIPCSVAGDDVLDAATLRAGSYGCSFTRNGTGPDDREAVRTARKLIKATNDDFP